MNEKDFPRGVEVVAGPFILDDKNRVLLVKSPKWKDVWLICGGHVEVGESIESALIRETKEELGIDIDDIRPLSFDEGIFYPPDFKRNAHFIFLNYIARYKSGEFKLQEDEISEYKWFEIEEALELKNLKESTVRPIRLLKKMKDEGNLEFKI